jgi:effector-binding domain-containing protein
MENAIEIKELPPQPVLSLRSKVTMAALPGFIGSAFSRLFPYLASLGESPVGPPLAVYHGMPTDEGIDVELCVPTGTVLAAWDDIGASELPGGKFASVMHLGPYEKVGDTYALLQKWIVDNCYVLAGSSREVYIVGVGQADPDAYVTEILFPVTRM